MKELITTNCLKTGKIAYILHISKSSVWNSCTNLVMFDLVMFWHVEPKFKLVNIPVKFKRGKDILPLIRCQVLILGLLRLWLFGRGTTRREGQSREGLGPLSRTWGPPNSVLRSQPESIAEKKMAFIFRSNFKVSCSTLNV